MHLARSTFFCYFVVSLSLFCLVTTSRDDKSDPVVQINSGKLRGRVLKSDYGADYYSFRGIPFGKPPVKDLRFKAPQPVEQWDGILDATEESHLCIQYDIFLKQFTGDEDCLNLNVHSPKLDGTLPVLFFIHGGGYFAGTGAPSLYGEQRFMDKAVVLVTINYRLGPFGFLSTGDEASPGNYGMLDQVLALKWVQDNIAAFGGDPNRVTIFGESAGGASVALHMLSPLSKGLFHGAIPQSGTAISEWATRDNLNAVKEVAKELGEALKCPTNCTKSLVECLRRKSALDITVKSAVQALGKMMAGGSFMSFWPVVDKSINGDNAFLPDKPIVLLKENRINVVPTMIGVIKDEALLLLGLFAEGYGGIREIKKQHTAQVMKGYSSYLFETADREQKVTAFIEEHLKPVDESNLKEKIAAISGITDDFFMEYPADETIEILTQHKVPTFAYKLTYRGMYSAVEKLLQEREIANRDWQMVTHLDEMQYLFRCDYFVSTDLDGDDKKMADILLTLWTNFAATKVPSLEGSDNNYAGFEWHPVTSDHVSYLDLSLKPKMVDGYLCERYDIWKTLYKTFGHKDEL